MAAGHGNVSQGVRRGCGAYREPQEGGRGTETCRKRTHAIAEGIGERKRGNALEGIALDGKRIHRNI